MLHATVAFQQAVESLVAQHGWHLSGIDWDDFAELVALVPALNTDAACPACAGMGSGMRLASVITHLNDTHRWTRERIADWLDTLDVDLTVTAASKGD